MPRQHKSLGSSKAGRPRKAGDRYPSGKLKPQPVAPNARVVADRERLVGPLGNLTLADNPMDVALARRWLTERQHKAGAAFAAAQRRAGLDAPGMDRGGLRESSTTMISDIGRKGMQDWTHHETATVFDAVFNKVAPDQSAAEAANLRWRTLCAVMSAEERSEVTDVCVRSSWPQWVIQRAAGHMATPWECKRDLLVSGLDKIANELWPRSEKVREAQSVAQWDMPRGRPVEDVTDYVTPEGEPVLTVVRRTWASR